MYEPRGASKKYLYIFFFSAVLFMYGFLIYSRPLIIQSACSDMALKTSSLTRTYTIDPESDFDVLKAKCVQTSLASSRQLIPWK